MSALALLPLELSSFPVPLLIGMAFGFVLESSGFGDARRLAAQFYLSEMRVLKVMFTAIITCMVLLVWAGALGWLDLDAISVNPTYLGSGILGGLILGFGFIIGGYCPGTSIVSAATLKIDGAFFLGGVGLGAFVFGETADGFRSFYDTAGALGRFTLPEWLGIPVGVVVLLVVLMAFAMFWAAELCERIFGRAAVKGGRVLLIGVLVLALVLPVVGQPDITDKVARLEPEMQPLIEERAFFIDHVELLGLMHGQIQGAPGRFRLVLIDVRPEAEFNLFHLLDAERWTREDLEGEAGRALTGEDYANAITVLVDNDETEAVDAWKTLYAHGVSTPDEIRHFVLADGLDRWLGEYRHGLAAGDSLFTFDSALGERYLFARPPLSWFLRLAGAGGDERVWKVKHVIKAPVAGGGCG